MSPQVEVLKSVPAPEPKAHNRLIGATFIESIPFSGEVSSIALGNKCDSIAPARLESDGTAVPIEKGQQSMGILVKRKVRDMTRNTLFVDQCFVPWANIRGLVYGE